MSSANRRAWHSKTPEQDGGRVGPRAGVESERLSGVSGGRVGLSAAGSATRLAFWHFPGIAASEASRTCALGRCAVPLPFPGSPQPAARPSVGGVWGGPSVRK